MGRQVEAKKYLTGYKVNAKSRDQGHGLFFNLHQVHRSINKAILPANGKV
jgi:hypothetical protein